MAFRPAIEQTPGQVYASALLFSPSQSNLREKFKDIVPQWIRVKPQLHERWSPCLQTLACGRWIGKVAFSRDGKLLASSSNGLTSSRYEHLDIWDPQTGECQSHLKASTEGSALEKLAPDGQIVVSVSRDGIISLWDMAKCENRFILENHPRPITAAEFSFDSKSLALGSQDGIIRLLDTQRGEHRCTLEGHSEEIVSLVFSPDCTMIATGAKDRTAQIWNLQTGSRRFTIERPASPSLRGFPLVEMMVFSPQSRFLASTSGENAIRLWDAVNGECRFDLEGCSGTVLELKFSPDGGLLASASQDNTVRLWDMQTGGCRATTTGCGMAFSPDGQFLALRSRDNLVRLWSVQREEYRSILDGHTQVVSTLCFSPDGRFLVSGSGDCTVRLWDMHMGDYFPIDESESASAKVSEVVFLPNGKLVASVSSNRRIRLWNSETGDCCLDYEGHSVSFSSDGQLVISASEDGVRLVDVRTGHHRFLVEGYIYVAVLSPDGQLAAATSHDQSIQLWNTHNGDSSFTFEGHHSTSVSSLIFSPNGDLIASRLEVDGAEIWNTRTGECVATFTDRSDIPGTMAFAPNGELLASGGYGPPHCLRLWDVLAGCLRFNLKGHSDHIETVVFSPNSRLVAGGSWDPTVLLWDTETGECILTIPCLSLKPRIEFLTGIDAVFVDGIAHETGSTKMTQAEIASQGRLLSDLQVDSSREWVTKSSERLLWLPPERRGYRYAVWRNKIAIGAGNGRMTFLTIEDEPGRQSGDDQRREEAMALRPTQLLPPPS